MAKLFSYEQTEFSSAVVEQIDAWLKQNGKPWDKFTQADLMSFIEDASLDADEYFMPAHQYRDYVSYQQPIFIQPTRQLAVYWAPGSNEGYYVTVVRIYTKPRNPIQSDIIHQQQLSGKFWTWQRAQFATNVLQYLINRIGYM